MKLKQHPHQPQLLIATTPPPAILHVSPEARKELIDRKFFINISTDRILPFYFNMETDTLRFHCLSVMDYSDGTSFSRTKTNLKDLPLALKGDFSHTIKQIHMVKNVTVSIREEFEFFPYNKDPRMCGNMSDEIYDLIDLAWARCQQEFLQLEQLTVETDAPNAWVPDGFFEFAAKHNFILNECTKVAYHRVEKASLVTRSGNVHHFIMSQFEVDDDYGYHDEAENEQEAGGKTENEEAGDFEATAEGNRSAEGEVSRGGDEA